MTLFEAIDENVQHGIIALDQTLRQAKLQVAQNRHKEVAVTEMVATLLLAAQYESRLHWLINHPNSRLTPSDIMYIRGAGGTTKKWDALLKASLILRKNIRESTSYTPDQAPRVLGPDERRKYSRIRTITQNHLDTLIDIRNSLAHGEWSVALTRQADGVNSDRTKTLNSVSLYRTVITKNLLDHLWHAHYDAQVTKAAFERDFDKHAEGMFNAATRLQRGDEQRWLAIIQKSYRGGRNARKSL